MAGAAQSQPRKAGLAPGSPTSSDERRGSNGDAGTTPKYYGRQARASAADRFDLVDNNSADWFNQHRRWSSRYRCSVAGPGLCLCCPALAEGGHQLLLHNCVAGRGRRALLVSYRHPFGWRKAVHRYRRSCCSADFTGSPATDLIILTAPTRARGKRQRDAWCRADHPGAASTCWRRSAALIRKEVFRTDLATISWPPDPERSLP